MLAGDRSAQLDRQLEQLLDRDLDASQLVRVVRVDEERRVEIAVACVAERDPDQAVAAADVDGRVHCLLDAVERHDDVLGDHTAAAREHREGKA